jgi:hypothetical protein
MALIHRVTHLSKLAFFVALGVAATIVDACGGRDDDAGNAPAPPKGGSPPTGQAGAQSVGQGGGTQPSAGGTKSTGGTLGIIDAGPPPKDADLWDVICE